MLANQTIQRGNVVAHLHRRFPAAASSCRAAFSHKTALPGSCCLQRVAGAAAAYKAGVTSTCGLQTGNKQLPPARQKCPSAAACMHAAAVQLLFAGQDCLAAAYLGMLGCKQSAPARHGRHMYGIGGRHTSSWHQSTRSRWSTCLQAANRFEVLA